MGSFDSFGVLDMFYWGMHLWHIDSIRVRTASKHCNMNHVRLLGMSSGIWEA